MFSLEGCNRLRKPWPFSVSLNLMCGVGCWASDLGPWASTLPVNILAAPVVFIASYWLVWLWRLRTPNSTWGAWHSAGAEVHMQKYVIILSATLLCPEKKLLNKSDKPQEMAQHINCSNNCIFEKNKYLRRRMLPGAVHQRLMHRNPIICLRNAQNNPCDLNNEVRSWRAVTSQCKQQISMLERASIGPMGSDPTWLRHRPFVDSETVLCLFYLCS